MDFSTLKINFYNRWNLDINGEEKKEKFRSSFNISLVRFIRDLAINNKTNYATIVSEFQVYSSCPFDLRNTFESRKSFEDYLWHIQILLYVVYEYSAYKFDWYNLYLIIKKAIEISQIEIEIAEQNNDMPLLFPAGAKELDNTLVIDNLLWLINYPRSHENFKNALKGYMNKEPVRNTLDNLRASLEFLVQDTLGNTRNLENNKIDLGKYLQSKGISVECRNMFQSLIANYTLFQNKHVKHNDNGQISDNEIEYLIYLTGSFMRLIIQCSNSTEKEI